MQWPVLLILGLSSVVSGQTAGSVDYRYLNIHKQWSWCVYCSQADIEKNGAESKCIEKDLPTEIHELNGKNVTFWAFCTSLGGPFSRYIKNCTAPPKIDGATVNCNDVRVHDNCSVVCTGLRMVASNPQTTCDPSTGKWTEVNCRPDRCPPLKDAIIQRQANTSCDTVKELVIDTECEVSCPTGYKPTYRVVKCKNGSWELIKPCAPLFSNRSISLPVHGESGKLPIIIGSIVVLLIITVALIFCLCRKCKRRRKAPGDKAEESMKIEEVKSLITGDSTSRESEEVGVVDSQKEEPSLSNVDETGSETSSSVKESTPTSSLPDSLPPDYLSVVGGDDSSGKCFAPLPSCRLEIHYITDSGGEECLPESRILYIAPGTQLLITAVCTEGHTVVQFNHGPFFKDNTCQMFQTGISVRIMRGDEGMYLLFAKCEAGQQIEDRLTIKLAENSDDTQVKQVYNVTDDLGSLNSTVTGPSLTAHSEPSKELRAEPFSLESNPEPLMESGDGDAESEELDAGAREDAGAGAGGGTYGERRERGQRTLTAASSTMSIASQISTAQEDDSKILDCTLPLIDLQKKRSYKKTFDQLCLSLEPLNQRAPDKTIYGATLHILGYSIDKVEHIMLSLVVRRLSPRKGISHSRDANS